MNHKTLPHVIIVGAGPVGLFLACELGLRGLSVPTIESFDRRGLLEPLTAATSDLEAKAAAHWLQQKRRAGGLRRRAQRGAQGPQG